MTVHCPFALHFDLKLIAVLRAKAGSSVPFSRSGLGASSNHGSVACWIIQHSWSSKRLFPCWIHVSISRSGQRMSGSTSREARATSGLAGTWDRGCQARVRCRSTLDCPSRQSGHGGCSDQLRSQLGRNRVGKPFEKCHHPARLPASMHPAFHSKAARYSFPGGALLPKVGRRKIGPPMILPTEPSCPVFSK